MYVCKCFIYEILCHDDNEWMKRWSEWLVHCACSMTGWCSVMVRKRVSEQTFHLLPSTTALLIYHLKACNYCVDRLMHNSHTHIFNFDICSVFKLHALQKTWILNFKWIFFQLLHLTPQKNNFLWILLMSNHAFSFEELSLLIHLTKIIFFISHSDIH